MYILHPCAWICLRQQSPHSAQQDKLSWSVICRLLLFRPSLKWQDHYHKRQLLPLGNICMSASLSASFPVSICHPFIVLFSCFLVPSFILPNTLFLSLILSLYGGQKTMHRLWGTKQDICMKKGTSERKAEKRLQDGLQTEFLWLCILKFIGSLNKVMPNPLHWSNSTFKEPPKPSLHKEHLLSKGAFRQQAVAAEQFQVLSKYFEWAATGCNSPASCLTSTMLHSCSYPPTLTSSG